MSSIRAHDTSIKLFLDGWEKIEVPNFQRKYVWEKKEITDFLEAVVSSDAGFYIGTIVVAPAQGKSVVQVIDGQQRLVTLALLLLSLRDLMHEITQEIVAEPKSDVSKDIAAKISDIDKLLLHKKLDDDEKIRSTPRMYFESDTLLHNYYWAIVKEYVGDGALEGLKSLSIGTDPSNYSPARLLITNFELIKTYTKNYVLQTVSSSLTDQYKKLVAIKKSIDELTVVEIKVDSYAYAFEIYEGLNSKGVQLSVSDLMRSLIYRHGTESPELIEDWEELDSIFYNLQNNIFPKFLRRYWISKEQYVSSKDLYDAIKKKISGDPKNASIFTKTIISDARFYFAILNNNTDELKSFLPPTNQDIYPYFDRFRLLKNDQIYEVLISIKDKLQTARSIRSGSVKSILMNFWIMVFRSSYSLVSPSKYERKFATYCEEIRSLSYADFLIYSDDFIKKELAPLVNDRDNFINTLSEYEFSSNESLATFIIAELVYNDEGRKKDFESQMAKINEGNTSAYTLEHILPKKPKDHWGFYKKEVDNLIKKIGNLTFLTPDQNYKAGNKKFTDKLTVYKATGFEHHKKLQVWESDFSGNIDGVEQGILRRGKELADTLEKFYKI